MPGLDRSGPSGLGPMTGGGRGCCNPREFRQSPWGLTPYPGRGGGRGWRHWQGGIGTPRRMRGRSFGPWRPGTPRSTSRKEEAAMFREYADWLKEELGAVEERIRDVDHRAEQGAPERQ